MPFLYIECMKAVKVQVLLIMGGFNVDSGVDGVVSEVEVNIQEGSVVG